jgi:undecaprenyl-diphosphatase
MTIPEAILLGILQGFTEFFPVSSSGHLVLAEALLGVNPPGVSFEVLVHISTALSVALLYGQRIGRLVTGVFRGRSEDIRYVGLLALATLPAGVVGLTLRGPIARFFDSPTAVALFLLLTGCVVYTTRCLVGRGLRRDPGWPGSLGVGLAQALAILPGVSRSGLTVTAALAARTEVVAAAEFSFLLSLPAIIGAALLELPDLRAAGAPALAPLLAASLSAFLAGLAAILLFVRWLRGGRFHRFAYYCWTVGGAYIVYALLTGRS